MVENFMKIIRKCISMTNMISCMTFAVRNELRISRSHARPKEDMVFSRFETIKRL